MQYNGDIILIMNAINHKKNALVVFFTIKYLLRVNYFKIF